MPVTTFHNYIDTYPISNSATKLILGTIHPHLVENFNINFFYGNVGSFWDILSNAFPQQQFNNLEEIIQTLNNYNVAISDIIRQCDRSDQSVTADSELYNIVNNRDQIRDGLINSRIETIYFTSRFGKNNAARLFVEMFQIRKIFNDLTNEFIIPANYFGREIKGIVLYSPSNNANRGIARSAQYLNNRRHYQQFNNPIKQFKVEFYREKFNFFDDL